VCFSYYWGIVWEVICSGGFMKVLAFIALSLLVGSCAAMKASQLQHVCNKRAAHSEGRVAAALQLKPNLDLYNKCDPAQKEMLAKAYNDGFAYYNEYEANKVGQIDGVAGFGANIRYVCVGKLFHQNYIGKGSSEGKARNHLNVVCRSSDNGPHCGSMYQRCRRVNFGNLTEDL